MTTKTSNPPERDRIDLDDLRHRAGLVAPFIAVCQVAKILPAGRRGRPIHVSTIIRWIVNGTLSPNGERVHLQAVRMGGRWLTTREWLDDYARRLTPSFGGADPVRASAASTQSAAWTARDLDAARI